MTDTKPFVHGEEGTHSVCANRLAKDGGKSHCCTCEPHEDCGGEFPKTETAKEDWDKEISEAYYAPWGSHPADKLALLLSMFRRVLAKERNALLAELLEEFEYQRERGKYMWNAEDVFLLIRSKRV